MEDHRLFRKDRQETQGDSVALYVSGQLECTELLLGMNEDPTESLWIRIKGWAGSHDIIVGSVIGCPTRKIEKIRASVGGATPNLQTLVLMGDFHHSDISWRNNITGHSQSKMMLECIDDNLFLRVREETIRRGAMPDLILTSKEGMVGNVKQGRFGLQ
ncbi:dtw domain-containing protein 2 [Pitangus sulphuratus]|nr:dtw domain-containing protein 2 [Pitangus sulphuratus]